MLDVLNVEDHDTYLEEALSESTSYSSGAVTYDDFMTAYFDNLTYNIGVNYKGSCGYVAMAMLLSYYDTYLNDNIIPEQYDIVSNGNDSDIISHRNSPGVLRDIVVNIDDTTDNTLRKMSATDYYSHIDGLSNASLHAKLITIGASHGYYNFSASSAQYSAGTYFSSRYVVLNDYLLNVAQMNSTDYELSYLNYESDSSKSDSVKQFALQRIMEGKPVLLSIYGAKGGHVVVAYDYEYDEDTSSYSIYCHMGWGANKTHVTPESEGFTVYRTALTLDLDTEHSHSNNYGITTIINNVPNTEYYCYDNCNIITYINKRGEHNYTNSYDPYSTTQHKAYCECGEYILEEHSSSIDACTLCGEPHTHDYSDHYSRVSGSQHRSYCACGASKLSAHVTSSGSGVLNNRVCIFCLATVEEGFSIILSTSQLPHTENGSYILPSGIIVLMDEDIEAYMNGTLEFIYPNEDEVA
ncbi:MAG: hypothetical protein IJX58_06775 [Clostridia bacterium]|nr:hypothetical protein [Clostridia bacterium]